MRPALSSAATPSDRQSVTTQKQHLSSLLQVVYVNVIVSAYYRRAVTSKQQPALPSLNHGSEYELVP